jgi:hypothetical protein
MIGDGLCLGLLGFGLKGFYRGLDKLKNARQTGEWLRIFTRQVRKQLAQYEEIVSEKEKNSPGWRVGLNFCSPILISTRIWRVGEWLSAPLD